MARKLTDVEKAERLLAETIAFCKVNGIEPITGSYSYGGCCAVGAIAKMQNRRPWSVDLPAGMLIGSIIMGNDENAFPADYHDQGDAISMALGRSFQDALREG